MAVSRAYIEALIARLEPDLRREFMAALDDWRRNIDLQAVARALERGDIAGAVQAANIQPGALTGLARKMEGAFAAGGAAEAQGLRLNIIFNARDFRSEAIIRESSATLIQAVTEDTRATLRTVMADGLSRGQGAATTARQIRPYIGMTEGQTRYALNFRRKLETDPKALLVELERDNYKNRDHRLDGIVRRAVKSGEPIAARDIDKIMAAYRNRSIAWRAKMIARSETLRSVNIGRFEAYRQAVDSGKVREQDIRRTWNATPDKRTRDTHAEMGGQTVGLNEAFVSPSGARLRYPGDPLAPAHETINCRCNVTYRIDHLANVA
jgi:hypothetical protein